MKIIPQMLEWGQTTVSSGWLADFPVASPVVWQAWLPQDASTHSQLFALLSVAERARLKRLRQRPDQLRFLTGRGLLRLLVAAELNLPADRIEFAVAQHGKPFVVVPAGARLLHFNVAHSGQLVVIAFSCAYEVGVDVEEIRPSSDLGLVARHFFSENEYCPWLRLSPEEQATRFYQAWTRHEARLKALGSGIAADFKTTKSNGGDCLDLELPAGYQGAVAWGISETNSSQNEKVVPTTGLEPV